MRGAVREPHERDRDAWLELWADYLRFYETELDDAVTQATWERLIAGDPEFGGLVAVTADDMPIGLVHYVVHSTTWDTRLVGYLEDLFVAPDHRGQAVGRALIEQVIALGRARGWSETYWITAADNEGARRLYRKLATETTWVRYEVDLVERTADRHGP